MFGSYNFISKNFKKHNRINNKVERPHTKTIPNNKKYHSFHLILHNVRNLLHLFLKIIVSITEIETNIVIDKYLDLITLQQQQQQKTEHIK